MSQRNHRWPVSSRSGFTLVELLVVIGIIALLVGILLPVLGKAREQGNATKCASNLRQVALGVVMYANEWKVLPGPVIPSVLDPQTVNRSPAMLSSYYIARQWSSNDLLQKYVGKSEKIWLCPSSSELTANAMPVSATSPYRFQKLGYTYRINNQSTTNAPFFFGSHTNANTADEKRPKKLSEVDAAAKTGNDQYVKSHTDIWMVSDLDGRNFSTATSDDFGISLSSIAAEQRPYQPVHRSSGKPARNYVFFDAHVEMRRIDNMPANP